MVIPLNSVKEFMPVIAWPLSYLWVPIKLEDSLLQEFQTTQALIRYHHMRDLGDLVHVSQLFQG